MVYTVARQEPGAVVITVLAPLTADDRPVLCRAVKEMLRSQVGHLVFDLRRAEPGPEALTTAARIHRMCGERQVECTVVADNLTGLRRALSENTHTELAHTLRPGPERTIIEIVDDDIVLPLDTRP